MLGSKLAVVCLISWCSLFCDGVSALSSAETVAATDLIVYVGTYTRGTESEGIYRCKLNMATGELQKLGVTKDIDNPSFLEIHPSGKFLYCVNEVGDFQGASSGAISAFAISPENGSLRFLNQTATGGADPCHLVIDKTGRNALVANYTGGSVASLPIGSNGQIGAITTLVQHQGTSVNPRRQSGPHALSINLDSANQFAVVADLGLDKLLVYRFDAEKGTLAANATPGIAIAPASGPRHFAFHPNGHFGYVINEMALTITALAYNPQRGVFSMLQTIATVPDGVDRKGLSTAEIRVHPTGKFLYGSNRGHNSIAVYRIEPESGRLTLIEIEPTQGKTPRNFFIDPSGTFLLAENQSSGTIVVFRIDQATGVLSATGHSAEIPAPVCIRTLGTLAKPR
jgi:6-phosphogluconolactonase